MPRFEPKTYSTFLKRMAQRVVARTTLTDVNRGGALHTILSSVAREMDDISFQMQQVADIWDIDTATGEDLDARAEDYPGDQVPVRYKAAKATGSVVFARTGTTGTVSIPIGTEVAVPSGPVFYTTVAGSILAGNTTSAAVTIEAAEAGPEGNTDPATITLMRGVTGVETVTNASATTGGQDEETNAEFRSRIKAYVRSLPRGTPDALKFAVLNTTVAGFGTIRTAEVVELEGADLGKTYVYVDDGNGTVGTTATNISGTPEVVVNSAAGGEERIFLDNKPLVLASTILVEVNAVPQTEGVDYTINRATGQITLTTALSPADQVTAEYTWYTGLIAEAQKIVDGDATDRINYPGYRAAGTQVFVLPPTVFQQVVEGTLILEEDFTGDRATVVTEATNAVSRYINSLGINGDVIYTEIVTACQNVVGVRDVVLTSPTANVIIGSGELARVLSYNIDLVA